jgi:hypothetical protein
LAPPLIFKTNKTMAKKMMGPGPKKQTSKGPSVGSGNPFTGKSKERGSAYSTAAQKRMASEAEKFGKYGVPTKTRVLPELMSGKVTVKASVKKPVIKKKK